LYSPKRTPRCSSRQKSDKRLRYRVFDPKVARTKKAFSIYNYTSISDCIKRIRLLRSLSPSLKTLQRPPQFRIRALEMHLLIARAISIGKAESMELCVPAEMVNLVGYSDNLAPCEGNCDHISRLDRTYEVAIERIDSCLSVQPPYPYPECFILLRQSCS
jgi:hypothetical protein